MLIEESGVDDYEISPEVKNSKKTPLGSLTYEQRNQTETSKKLMNQSESNSSLVQFDEPIISK